MELIKLCNGSSVMMQDFQHPRGYPLFFFFFLMEEILIQFSLSSVAPLFTHSFEVGKKKKQEHSAGAHKVHFILICLISGFGHKKQSVLVPNSTLSSFLNTDLTIYCIHLTMKCPQRVCAAFAVFKSSSEILSVSHQMNAEAAASLH